MSQDSNQPNNPVTDQNIISNMKQLIQESLIQTALQTIQVLINQRSDIQEVYDSLYQHHIQHNETPQEARDKAILQSFLVVVLHVGIGNYLYDTQENLDQIWQRIEQQPDYYHIYDSDDDDDDQEEKSDQ